MKELLTDIEKLEILAKDLYADIHEYNGKARYDFIIYAIEEAYKLGKSANYEK